MLGESLIIHQVEIAAPTGFSCAAMIRSSTDRRTTRACFSGSESALGKFETADC
jgi:hypothetical protein